MTPLDGDGMTDEGLTGQIPEITQLLCWRCGLSSTPDRGRCVHCRARLVTKRKEIKRPDGIGAPVMKVMVGYAFMLGLSLLWGWGLHFSNLDPASLRTGTIALGIADGILTVALWVWIGRLSSSRPSAGMRTLAWVVSWPALAGVLAFNFGYNRLLEQYLNSPEWLKVEPLFQGFTLVNFMIIAVQPAVVEELFFRHLALGALHEVSSVHAAVWVSACMFALAHIYAPLGIPWLLLVGVVFGYARVGGGLLLPMLLHGVHNACVLWIQGGA